MKPIQETLSELSVVIPFHPCHEWIGTKDKDGYGKIKRNGVFKRSHRLALGIKIGRDLGPLELACHSCDNPSCVNPDHLFVGTALDNMRDKVSKGRMVGPCADNKAKTHCSKGHEFTPENTYIRKITGKRNCRKCHVIEVTNSRKK